MKVSFVDATWQEELALTEQVISEITKKARSIALFASVQFLKLDTIIAQLKRAGITVLETRAKRTNAARQILGCDVYHDSFDADIIADADLILYIGDGLFHPQALLYAQILTGKIHDVLLFDPLDKQHKYIGRENILPHLKKLKANILRYLSADTIGILVTLKPGQQHLDLALKLKETLASSGKKAYLFLDNTFDYAQLENFSDIKAWVNTACPRIGLDDIITISKPLINLNDATRSVEMLEAIKNVLA
ncbi:hypothetical protein COT72_04255 [archaeon CG10_big_fil_rev_8_21_14_0_10_43_11]|nr:MAG: hypothetical protein COT72_04255 [archaeon CG10_big_fil_rev_8_21_14_0_10_43_11]